MTDREELLMVQVVKLQHELSNAEYFCNRWRKTARMFYGSNDYTTGEPIQNESKLANAVIYFEDTYYRENVKADES